MEETKHIKISDYNYPLTHRQVPPPCTRPVQAVGLSARSSQRISFHLITRLPGAGRTHDFQQYQGHTGASAFPQGNRCPHRDFLLGTHPAERLRIEFPANPTFSLAVYGGQPEEMERRPATQGNDRQRETVDTDRYILEVFGELPIPPYLNRETTESDKETYQTVYSKIKGSVAAPTAGLHFTERVLNALKEKGVDLEEVTLHVGAGTFKPVKSEEIEGHEMHTEYISVNKQTIEKLLAHNGEAVAVGTTSVRTLESLYYIGVTTRMQPDASQEELHVKQWQPYETHPELTTVEALQSLLDYMNRHQLDTLHTSTQIIIAPGYTYKIVKKMVTNFHQPQSTLLLLVSAFVKGDWHTIYDYALAHDFRFLSYGDSSLLIP